VEIHRLAGLLRVQREEETAAAIDRHVDIVAELHFGIHVHDHRPVQDVDDQVHVRIQGQRVDVVRAGIQDQVRVIVGMDAIIGPGIERVAGVVLLNVPVRAVEIRIRQRGQRHRAHRLVMNSRSGDRDRRIQRHVIARADVALDGVVLVDRDVVLCRHVANVRGGAGIAVTVG